MKKKIFKCSNCGSSDFKQLADDLFECAYCHTKIQNDNSVKDDFVEDINKLKNKNRIKYIKAHVTEDEFYKKAIAHLAMNKYTPVDLLDLGEFGFVEYDYKFYAILDVDFTVMKVSVGGDDVVSLLTNQKINSEFSNSMCIELGEESDDVFKEEVISSVNDLELNGVGKVGNIKKLSQEEIKSVIDSVLEDKKKKILNVDKTSNYVAHKINKIDIVALPVYSLKFKYNGKQYNISSSAQKLKIIGDFPRENMGIKKEVENKVLPLKMLSSIISVLAIILSFVNLYCRMLGLVKYNIILALISVISFVISWLVYKRMYKKKSVEIYENKIMSLSHFLLKNDKKLTKADEEYIQKILRWF